jgi:hypothetical protein
MCTCTLSGVSLGHPDLIRIILDIDPKKADLLGQHRSG